MFRSLILALFALVFLLCPGLAAAEQYEVPTLTHWCVGLKPDGSLLPPGQIQVHIRPETDRLWSLHRYPDGLGGFSARGTLGMHTSDYESALADLGYKYDVVSVRDAYCVRDRVLLDRGVAVRIAGDNSTPFSPGVFSWGRRNWDTVAWDVMLQYGMAALVRNMGRVEAEFYAAVIREQLALAWESCRNGSGPASDPSAGAWRLNAAGACKPTSWTRWGSLAPDWARQVNIGMSPRG